MRHRSTSKETDSGTRCKLTLSPNRSAGSVADTDSRSIVQEASMSVPLTDLQTRLIVGQVPDWSGYEYQQPTLNPFITHNLLFDFTLPTTYTGAGIDIHARQVVGAQHDRQHQRQHPAAG